MESLQRIRRVLVVDDQPGLLQAIKSILEDAGFQVMTATNGRDAGAIIADQQIDLLLTDLGMPDEDGIELVRRLKSEGHDLKIIAMSGTFGPELLKATRLLGADAALAKPMKASQLLDCIRKLDVEAGS